MTDRLSVPPGPEDHVRGAPGADLVLVMYGDFECPYCAAAQSILERVRARLGDRLAFVYRHFPLDEVHPHARQAAEASEAAAAQGRFWEMHDVLYAAQGRLAERDLLSHAEAVGLDVGQVDTDLLARRHGPRVDRDVAGGRDSGVTGTPAFFANGTRVDGAFDAGSLVDALTASVDRT